MAKKYTRLSKVLATIAMGGLFALGFQNCSGFGSAGGSLTLEDSLSFTGNPVLTNQSLEGTWSSSSCYNDSSGNGSYMTTFEFSPGGSFVVEHSLYAGVSCPGTPTGTLEIDGIYSLGGYDGTVSGATDVTLSIDTIVLTPMNDVATSALNGITFCGINTWQTGITSSISLSASCLNTLPLPQQTTMLGISNNSLYTGNSDNSAIDPNSGAQFVGAQTPNIPTPPVMQDQ